MENCEKKSYFLLSWRIVSLGICYSHESLGSLLLPPQKKKILHSLDDGGIRDLRRTSRQLCGTNFCTVRTSEDLFWECEEFIEDCWELRKAPRPAHITLSRLIVVHEYFLLY